MLDEEEIKRTVDPRKWAREYATRERERMTAIKDFRDVFRDANYLDALAILYELEPDEYRRLSALLKPYGVRSDDLLRKTKGRASERKKEQKLREKAAAANGSSQSSRPALEPLAPPAPEPWDRPVDGLTLLNDLKAYVAKFFVLTEDKLIAITLWIVFSYLLDIAEYSPILAITSATKRCGKTFLMELLDGLMLKPLATANTTAAVIFRVIDQEGCNLLVDEFDTMKKGSDRLEEIRGIVNSAWRRKSAFVPRVEEEGGRRVVKRFSTWAAYAVAAIGKLPDTMEDRSIKIVMKRKSPKVKVERLIRRNVWAYQTAAELSRKIQRWVNDHRVALQAAVPKLPNLDDRAVNNWELLLAVADLAGGEWGLRARQAAVKLSSGRNDGGDDTGEMLIRDIRKVFDARQTSEFPDRIKSEDLCAELAAMESRPWGEWGRTRKPITQNALARQLKPFEIEPWGTVRFGDITLKGYMLKQFDEVFSSYPPENHDSNRHADTTVGGVGESDDFQASQKSERDGWKNGTSPHGENGCDDVPDQNAQNRRVREERQEMDGQPRADEDAYIDRQAEADCPPVCRHCGLEAETDAANCHHCGATYGVERR